MPKRVTKLPLPAERRILRSSKSNTIQITQPIKKNKRALDALDKKLSQISTNKKNGSPTPGNTVPWLLNTKQYTMDTNTSDVQGKSPILPVGLHIPIRSENETSPTPKRRKRSIRTDNNIINNNKTIKNRKVPLSKQSDISDEVSSIGLSVGDIMESDLIQSSPIRKSVAFSNNIEELDTILDKIKSSPIQSSSKKPNKSILRNKNDKQITNTLLIPDLQNDGTPEKTLFVQGRILAHGEYWSSGEVHQLTNKDSIIEFKNIINSGLIKLENDVGKKFEIYATFNNILPDNNKYAIGSNNTLHSNTDLLKLNFIRSVLPKIIDVSISDLVDLQPEIITVSENKDAFSIRTYIQIVKVLSFILSNAILVHSLPNNPHILERISLVYKASIEALENQQCSKQLIIAYINFLKDELFGEKHLGPKQTEHIVGVIVKIRELKSMSLVVEKLSLIKCLLRKYRYAMLKDIMVWLPGEVIPRLLLHNIEHGWTITDCAISILLDLLNVYRELNFNHTQVYLCIELKDISMVVPKKFIEPLQALMKVPAGQNLTLGAILRNHINILSTHGNFKVANDIWLATVGLLYNRDNVGYLLDPLNKVASEWIDLNRKCFKNSDSVNRLHALKVWRVIIHSIYSRLWYDTVSHKEIKSINKLLQVPFDMALTTQLDKSSTQGLLFLLNMMSFATSRLSYNLKFSKGTHFSKWFKTLQEIYLKLFNSSNKRLCIAVVKSMFRLFDMDCKLDRAINTSCNDKDSDLSGSEMMLTISGISLSDISCIDTPCSQDIIYEFSNSLKENVERLIKFSDTNDNENDSVDFPMILFDISLFRELSQILITYYSQNADSLLNPLDFIFLPTALVSIFSDVLFYDTSSDYLTIFLLQLEHVYPFDRKNLILELLFKEMFKTFSTSKNVYLVIHAFLNIENDSLQSYIHQILGRLSPTSELTLTQVYMILKIMAMFPNSQLLEKFYFIIFEERYDLLVGNYNFLNILRMESWSLNQIIKFTMNYYVHKGMGLNSYIFNILQDLIKRESNIFYYIAPIMEKNGDMSKIKILVNDNPQLINNSLFFEMPFFTEVLSKGLEKKLIKNLHSYPKLKQINLMKKFIIKIPQIFLSRGSPTILDFVKFSGPLSGERKSLAIEILKACYKYQMLPLANNVMYILLSNDNVTVVEDFLSGNNVFNHKILEDKILVKLASKSYRFKKDLLAVIKNEFRIRTDTPLLLLLYFIIEENDKLLIMSCIKEIFLSFIDAPTRLISVDKQMIEDIFHKVVELVLFNDDDSAVINFINLYLDMLPKEPAAQVIEGVQYFLSKLSDRKAKYGRDVEIERMDDILVFYKSNIRIPANDNGIVSDVSSTLTLKGLNNSPKAKSSNLAQDVSHTESGIDIPRGYSTETIAQHKPDIMKVTSSDAGSSLPEFVEGVEVKRIATTGINLCDNNPSMLLDIDLNSLENNKNLSQVNLAKSTQLSQKRKENIVCSENEPIFDTKSQENIIQVKETAILNTPDILLKPNINRTLENIYNVPNVQPDNFRVVNGYLERTTHAITEGWEEGRVTNTQIVGKIKGNDINDEKFDDSNKNDNKNINITQVQIEKKDGSSIGEFGSKVAIESVTSITGDNEKSPTTSGKGYHENVSKYEACFTAKHDNSHIIISPDVVTNIAGDGKIDGCNANLDNTKSDLVEKVNISTKGVSKPSMAIGCSKRIDNLSEDFEPVIPDGDDNFLKEMETLSVLLNQPTSTGSVKEVKIENIKKSPSFKQQVEKSKNYDGDVEYSYENNAVLNTTTKLIPSKDKQICSAEGVEYSDKEPKGIKIPIFNSRRMNTMNTQSAKVSPRKKSLRYANKSTVINVNIPKTFRRSVSPKPIIRHPTMTDSFGYDLIMSDHSHQGNSRSSPFTSLQDDFSSKKARRLVNKMRSISSTDLATLSPNERRNMRVEMLDFLMKLEHQSLSDP